MPFETKYNIVLTNEEKAYMAGFIDGEGCIGIRNGGSRKSIKIIRMHITNTNEEILRYIKDKIGFGSIYCGVAEGQYNNRDKARYVYEVSQRQCYAVLKEVLPYLRIKRLQAELVMSIYDLDFNGDINGREIYKEKIHSQIRILNKKGVQSSAI